MDSNEADRQVAWRIRPVLVILLSLLNILQGGTWAMFANLPVQSQKLFGFPDSQVQSNGIQTWILNANNIAQSALTPLAVWGIFGVGGLRRVIVISCVLIAGQQIAWTAAPLFFAADHDATNATDNPGRAGAAQALLYIGGMFGGGSMAFAAGTMTRFSATWFAPRFRTRITSLIFVCQSIGQGITSIVAIVAIRTEADLAANVYACTVLVTITVIVMVLALSCLRLRVRREVRAGSALVLERWSSMDLTVCVSVGQERGWDLRLQSLVDSIIIRRVRTMAKEVRSGYWRRCQ